jgi:phosphatidate phosphatase APP1
LPADAIAGQIKSDEEVVFFPTCAVASEDGAIWKVPVHGWIFEPEHDSLRRNLLLASLAASLGLGVDEARSEVFVRRARLFLADNERGKRIAIELAGQRFEVGESGANGHFSGVIELARDALPARLEAPQWLSFAAVLAADDERRYEGRCQLVAPEGVSVISDIDDTVKVSHVLDRRKLLEATFTRPFEAVPRMAYAFRAWAEAGAVFHYVSSSPWQLYPELEAFLRAEGFPAGSFHLKEVRLKDRTFLDLFAPAEETKPPLIEALLERCPGRRFLLVGDSGEHDPEVYGAVARRAPERIHGVLIRRVEGADNSEARFDAAFADLPRELWRVFEDPRRIVTALGAAATAD